jgi:hypothetical protein
MTLYEKLFETTGSNTIEIGKQLKISHQAVSKKKKGIPALKQLIEAMDTLGISEVEGIEFNYYVKIEKL